MDAFARAVLLLMVLSTAASLAHAEGGSGSRTLAHDEFQTLTIEVPEGMGADVEYRVTVVSGASVCVYVLNEAGHGEYLDPALDSFDMYEDVSNLDTRSAYEEFSLSDPGLYYVVIENSDPSEAPSYVQYTLTYDLWEESTAVPWLLPCAVIAIVVGVVAVALLLRWRSRAALGRAAQPPGQYPQAPYPGAQTPGGGPAPQYSYGQGQWGDTYGQGRWGDPQGQDPYLDPLGRGGYSDPYRDPYYDRDPYYHDRHYYGHDQYDHDHYDHDHSGISQGTGRSWGSSRSGGSGQHHSGPGRTTSARKRR